MKCEWISVSERLPQDGAPVLAVKQLKNKRLEVCLASCIPDYEHYDYKTNKYVRAPYWVCGGNNNVLFWTPLPDLPEPPAE